MPYKSKSQAADASVSAVFIYNDTGQMNLFILIPKNLFCLNLLISVILVLFFEAVLRS